MHWIIEKGLFPSETDLSARRFFPCEREQFYPAINTPNTKNKREEKHETEITQRRTFFPSIHKCLMKKSIAVLYLNRWGNLKSCYLQKKKQRQQSSRKALILCFEAKQLSTLALYFAAHSSTSNPAHTKQQELKASSRKSGRGKKEVFNQTFRHTKQNIVGSWQ